MAPSPLVPDEPRPYAEAARTYLRRGWSPIPLPPGQKAPPPKGWTGYAAPFASAADVEEWASNGHGSGNIGLRLGEDVIGIDVDAYGDKPGAATLAAAEAETGPLPPTWRSSARSDPRSGIYFFRVPPGRAWADVVGPGVEVVHHGHRYAVVAPSLHPGTGTPYRWFGPASLLPSAGPRTDVLEALPPDWVARLDRGPASEVSAKAHLEDHEVSDAVASLPGGPQCRWVASVVESAREELRGGSRHDKGREYVLVLVRAGEQGHRGAREALADLRAAWLEALAHGERRQPDHGEWGRMVAGAVAITAEKPTPEADKGCCGDDSFPVFDPGDGFWDERPVLRHVWTAARAGRTSPWAVLGCVLARVVTAVPSYVVLPKLVGGFGSLNLFVALVGPSGMGKGAAEAVAAACVDVGRLDRATVGSGEGIAHLYAKRVTGGGVERIRDAVLFSVPEVDNLAALGGRQGATLLPQLRIAWSGERLGFAYADKSKAIPVEAHEYRMGLVLGVQPGRAGALLDDSDGGTPQRFVWLTTTDPGAPDDPPPVPGPWVWPGTPQVFATHGKLKVLDVCAEAVAAVDHDRVARLRLEGEALESHAMLARLKIAAALGLLDGRLEVSPDDWDLAGQVMRVSSAVRGDVQRVLAEKVTRSHKGRAEVKALEAVVVEERVAEAAVARVVSVMSRALSRKGEMTSRELRGVVAGRDKRHFAAALLELVSGGSATVVEDGRKSTYRAV